MLSGDADMLHPLLIEICPLMINMCPLMIKMSPLVIKSCPLVVKTHLCLKMDIDVLTFSRSSLDPMLTFDPIEVPILRVRFDRRFF